MRDDTHFAFDFSHKVDQNLIDPCRVALKSVEHLGVGSGFRSILRAANDNGGEYEEDSDKVESYLNGKIPEAVTLLELAKDSDEDLTKILQICMYHFKYPKRIDLQFCSCIHQKKRSSFSITFC